MKENDDKICADMAKCTGVMLQTVYKRHAACEHLILVPAFYEEFM